MAVFSLQGVITVGSLKSKCPLCLLIGQRHIMLQSTAHPYQSRLRTW